MITRSSDTGLHFFNSPIRTEVLGIKSSRITGPTRVRGSSPSVVLDNMTQLFLRGGYEVEAK